MPAPAYRRKARSDYRRFITPEAGRREEFTAGILKAERGELALAVEIFRSMAGLFPDCGQTRNNLALVYEQQAARLEAAGAAEEAGPLREQAFAAYKAALAAEPELAACHLNFAHFHLRGGNPGKAREHLELFLKHNTDLERVEQARALAARLEGYEQVERPAQPSAIQLGRGPRAWSSNRSPASTRSCGTPGFWRAGPGAGWAITARPGKPSRPPCAPTLAIPTP
jgi:tetratricopeptide (TPR) repeat protein